VNFTLQPCGKDFGNNLHAAILEADRAEIADEHRCSFFWQEHHKSMADPAELNITRVESSQHLQYLRADRLPSREVEIGAKTIRARHAVLVHRSHSTSCLRLQEGGVQR
jgi:hypothetical protein